MCCEADQCNVQLLRACNKSVFKFHLEMGLLVSAQHNCHMGRRNFNPRDSLGVT